MSFLPNWGKKKYPGTPGQIGPRVKSGPPPAPKPVMSKAGTPMKASTPAPKKTPGYTYGPQGNSPQAKAQKPTYKKPNTTSRSKMR